jgi:hypothetical protein
LTQPPPGALQGARHASALLQWRSMRSGSVSTPCRICQALVGDSAAPKTRRHSMRQRIVKPKSPKVS